MAESETPQPSVPGAVKPAAEAAASVVVAAAPPAPGEPGAPKTPTTAAPAPAATAPKAPPPPPPPNPLPEIPLPFKGVDHGLRGYHADATVPASEVVSAARAMDAAGFSLDTITGVDWIAESQFEVVYDYFHPRTGLRAMIRTRIPRDNQEIPTISTVFPGANWHERETHDFFGIRFSGHPDLSPFLLPEDATYHPLRKDFTS